MKKVLYILLLAAVIAACGEKEPENIPGRGDWTETPGGGDNNENNNGDNTGNNDGNPTPVTPVDPSQVKEVKPTTELGSVSENVGALKLKPGKLIGIKTISQNVCNRLIKAGMCADIILSDADVFGITDDALESLFKNAGAAFEQTKAEIWGIHLPYKDNVAIDSKTASTLEKAYNNHVKMIELCLKYLKPKHLVIHPGNTSVYVGQADYEVRFKAVQQSLIKIQAKLDELNSQYGTKAVLCVENCPRKVAYDAPSMLNLLSAKGLEKTMICLDTGHAIVPLNGEYVNNDTGHTLKKAGDPVAMLKEMGTRVRTLHIQQNKGVKEGNTYDTHLAPFAGDHVDWGEFYKVLMYDCRYRGCFLYEVSYQTDYNGSTATIETCLANYKDFIYPAYLEYIRK